MRATWLVVLAACHSAGAGEDPPLPPPQSPPSFEHDMMVRFHMHENFDLLRGIEKLLVRGRLAEAKLFARAISEAPDEPGLGAWSAHAVTVRARAADLANADSTDAGCRLAARLGEACAGCHVDAAVVPEFRPSGDPPPDFPTLDARMARHLWATDRLWEGIVGGAEESWRAGLQVLAASPIESAEIGGSRIVIARQLQQLAQRARQEGAQPATLAERTRAYGEILTTCAKCHQPVAN